MKDKLDLITEIHQKTADVVTTRKPSKMASKVVEYGEGGYIVNTEGSTVIKRSRSTGVVTIGAVVSSNNNSIDVSPSGVKKRTVIQNQYRGRKKTTKVKALVRYLEANRINFAICYYSDIQVIFSLPQSTFVLYSYLVNTGDALENYRAVIMYILNDEFKIEILGDDAYTLTVDWHPSLVNPLEQIYKQPLHLGWDFFWKNLTELSETVQSINPPQSYQITYLDLFNPDNSTLVSGGIVTYLRNSGFNDISYNGNYSFTNSTLFINRNIKTVLSGGFANGTFSGVNELYPENRPYNNFDNILSNLRNVKIINGLNKQSTYDQIITSRVVSAVPYETIFTNTIDSIEYIPLIVNQSANSCMYNKTVSTALTTNNEYFYARNDGITITDVDVTTFVTGNSLASLGKHLKDDELYYISINGAQATVKRFNMATQLILDDIELEIVPITGITPISITPASYYQE